MPHNLEGFMKVWIVVALAVFPSVCFSQTKNPVSDVLREMLAGRQKNTVAAFEEMPADKFNYKPTPDQMTFAHLVVHIIGSNNMLCSKAADVPAPKVEEAKESVLARAV